MPKKVESPLVDVAMGYVNDINPGLNQKMLIKIHSLFSDYINEKISYERISIELKSILPNLSPLYQISSILNIQNDEHCKTSTVKSYIMNDMNQKRKKKQGWSVDEDRRLLLGIHFYGLDNWNHVSEFVGSGKTRSMCSQRWLRVLDPKISKNAWTTKEDQQLIRLIEIHGTKSWKKISNKLGNRSDVQCRYHYKQLLKDSKETIDKSPLMMTEQSFNDSISQNSASVDIKKTDFEKGNNLENDEKMQQNESSKSTFLEELFKFNESSDYIDDFDML